MNSDEEMYSAENSDASEEEEDEEIDGDDDFVLSLDHDSACAVMKPEASDENELEDDFRYVVLTADQIVQHMSDCIREVNTVVQVVFDFN
jgi:ariadne-1